MSTPSGKSILQGVAALPIRGWFTKLIPSLIAKVIDAMQYRNQVQLGGVVTGGTITASAVPVSTTDLHVVLKGRIMAVLPALTTTDLFTTAGTVARATYTSGADAAGITLASGNTAYVTVVVCNTNGTGGAVETDGGAAKWVAIVHGTASTFAAQTGFATSPQIQAALEAATGVHAGVSAWVHVCDILWDENGGSPTATITMNRNNVIRAE